MKDMIENWTAVLALVALVISLINGLHMIVATPTRKALSEATKELKEIREKRVIQTMGYLEGRVNGLEQETKALNKSLEKSNRDMESWCRAAIQNSEDRAADAREKHGVELRQIAAALFELKGQQEASMRLIGGMATNAQDKLFDLAGTTGHTSGRQERT